MKITCLLSPSLVSKVLREQCSDIADLFDNSLEPSREQIEDLGEIARAWLSSDPVRVTVAASAPEPEAIDPTVGAKPEPDEDPFRHYVNAVEITGGFTLPVMDLSGVNSPEIPDSSNSSENSNSSNDSEAGVTNPTNLIDKPVEKNSQPKNRSVVTVEDVKAALAEHGAESFAQFCGTPIWSAKGNLGKVIDRGVAGPKTVAWIHSLRASEKADTKKPEKLTETPKPVSERILWARAREICRVKTARTQAEERLLLQFVNSGATDIDWWLKQTFAYDSYGVLIP